MLDYIESPLRESIHNCTKRVLYPGQIGYGCGSLPKIRTKASDLDQSSSSRIFVTWCKAKFHKYIFRALCILDCTVDDEGEYEPTFLNKAKARHDWSEWKIFMEGKYNLLIENSIWELINPPSGANVIIGKWCFKLKKNQFEHLLKFKVRWVGHGYKQEEELDNVKTFAEVIKHMSYKWVFAVRVKRGYQIYHIILVTIFLYSFLDKVICVNHLHLFFTKLNKVCKLIKALYGLKKVSHIFYKTLVKFLKQLRFIQLEIDYEIFISSDKQLFWALYVDHLLILCLDISCLENPQQKLRDRFKMTNLGNNSCYFRMHFDQIVVEKITFCQSTSLKKLLDRFKMTGCKPTSIPMDTEIANCLLLHHVNAHKKTIKWYQSTIESLMWLVIHIRSDIAYSG